MFKDRLYYLVLSLSFLFLCIYVFLFTPSLPVSDQWELVPLLKTFTFGDLMSPHNEHRIFFPKLIYLGLAFISGWDVKLEAFVSLLFFSILIFLIWKSFLSTILKKDLRLLFFLALLSQFSPIHYENLLWGWQLQLTLCVLMVFVSFMLFYDSLTKLRPIIFAFASVFIASFSFFSGLIGGFTFLAGLLLNKKAVFINKVFFLLAFCGSLFVYFYKYSFLSQKSLVLSLDILVYFFVYMGANYVPTYKLGAFLNPIMALSAIWGLILIFLGCYFIKKTINFDLKMKIIPYLMISFSVFVAVSTSFGRVSYGLPLALLSRYHLFQMFYFLGLTWLILLFFQETQNKNYTIKRIMAVFFIVLILINWSAGIILGIVKSKNFLPIYKELSESRVSDNVSKAIYPDIKLLKERVLILKGLKYNVFK